MSNIYSKKDINNIILRESKGYFILNKKDMLLKENNETNSYVEPSANSTASSLATDIANTQSKNPHDDTFVVDTSHYDSNQSNNSVSLDVSGRNAQDAAKNLQNTMKNPAVKNLMSRTNVKAKVHLRNGVDKEHLNKLREGSVPFTKKEIKKMFKK
jgi:hypothetical protein